MILSERIARLLFLTTLFGACLLSLSVCRASTIYEWDDLNKPLDIADGYQMKKGHLIVRAKIPSSLYKVLETKDSIQLAINISGMILGNYKLKLNINKSLYDYNVGRIMKIYCRHLRWGINHFRFRVETTIGYSTSDEFSGFNDSNIIIHKLAFPNAF